MLEFIIGIIAYISWLLYIIRMAKQKPDVFTSIYKKFGLKITPQRTAIYEELIKAIDHPTAEAIYSRVRRKIKNISFDTVYRTLLSFLEIKLITLVEGTGEQKRFEPNLPNHHHCRCIKCHAIIDFESPIKIDIKIPKELKNDFKIIRKRIVLEGLCKNCKK